MANANKNNVTKRGSLNRPLTVSEGDQNFDELINVIEDLDLRVIRVKSIPDLLSAPKVEDAHYTVAGYHTGSKLGGGVFVWDATRPKADHNGGSVIDPTKVFPSDWTNSTSVSSWLNTTNTGSGCFVRTFKQKTFFENYGVIGGSETYSASNTVVLQSAKTKESRLFGTSGEVYWLAPNTNLGASSCSFYGEGSTLKQKGGTHDSNWILLYQNSGIKFKNFTIDGNRVNTPSLSLNRSLVTIYNTEGVCFADCVVKNSQAKGVSVTSSSTGSGTYKIRITGVTSFNCKMQCILTDATGTPECKDILISHCFIKDTDHGGIVVNDGSDSVVVHSCVSDVNNTAWDAIGVRGAKNVKITNCIGRRGRSGCRVWVLDAAAISRGEVADSVTLSNNTWEENSQGGLDIIGVYNMTVVGDISKNNNKSGSGYAGITVTQQAGVRRSKNITLSSVAVYDDQNTPTQAKGVFIAAADNVKVTSPVIYGNTVSNRVELLESSALTDIQVAGDGADGATHKFKSISTGSIAGSSTSNITVVFDTPFDVAPNWANASVSFASTQAYLRVVRITGLTKTAVQVLVANDNASTAATGTLYAEARVIT